MTVKYYNIYKTSLGTFAIAEEDGMITEFNLTGKCEGMLMETPLIKEAFSQLQDYLAQKRLAFDLPLNPKGTPFQKQVWEALLAIPYGGTKTYKEIAAAINNPKALRAVGMANNKNPIAIMIPCHRVVGSNGKLVGYAGGLEMKEQLLKLEGVR